MRRAQRRRHCEEAEPTKQAKGRFMASRLLRLRLAMAATAQLWIALISLDGWFAKSIAFAMNCRHGDRT